MSFFKQQISYQEPTNFINQYKQIGEEFCKVYYENMMKNGLNGVSHLYCPNICITFLDDECSQLIALNQKFQNLGIARFNYSHISGIVQPIGNDNIVINVTGHCASVGINGMCSEWTRFSETFILARYNDTNLWAIRQQLYKLVI
jgi:hypothetical protein